MTDPGGPIRPGGVGQSCGPAHPAGAVQPSSPAHPAGAAQSGGLAHADRPGRPRSRCEPARRCTPIEAESYRILRSRIDLSHLPPFSRAVTERVIHASADFDYATDLVCDEAALAAGVSALAAGAPVVADVAMVAAAHHRPPGHLQDRRIARQRGCRARSGSPAPRPGSGWHSVKPVPARSGWWGARRPRWPRFSAGMFSLRLVIGLPVGFVGAAEAKDALRASGLPALTNKSEKGGSAVAAAALNALLRAMPRGSSAKAAAGAGRCRRRASWGRERWTAAAGDLDEAMAAGPPATGWRGER